MVLGNKITLRVRWKAMKMNDTLISVKAAN